MTVNKPTPGQSKDTWGTTLNDALDALDAAAAAAQNTANAAVPSDGSGNVPIGRIPDLSGTYARVLVESGGAYPARPAVTGPVFYIGPDTPTDAVTGDVHIAA